MKKIMFNDKFGLTKAVLDGRKTMTRMIVPGRYLGEFPNEVDLSEAIYNGHAFMNGEVVAVAQSYESVLKERGGVKTIAVEVSAGFRNKMFVVAEYMPHQIRITNVRVERLQDISDEDVYKEGFTKEAVNNGWGNYAYHYEAMLVYYDRLGRSKEIRSRVPREAYAALIDRVCGNGTWASNPWVFVYEFELVK